MTPLGPFTGNTFFYTILLCCNPLDSQELGHHAFALDCDFGSPRAFSSSGSGEVARPLPYLVDNGLSNYDIHLEVHLATAKQADPVKISHSNFKYMYWSAKQQVLTLPLLPLFTLILLP